MKYAGYAMDKTDYRQLLMKAKNLSKEDAIELMDANFMAEMTKEKCRELLMNAGNLSKGEVDELIDFEFVVAGGPISVPSQVRYEYLRCKAVAPAFASWILQDTEEPLKRYESSKNEETVMAICRAMNEYITDFVIRFEGKSFESRNKEIRKRVA